MSVFGCVVCVCACVWLVALSPRLPEQTDSRSGALQQVIISSKPTFDPWLASHDIWSRLPAATGATGVCYTV